MQKHEWIFKGVVIVATLFAGFLIEEKITDLTIARYKRLLVRLVMNRLRTFWFCYNGILALEKMGRVPEVWLDQVVGPI